MNFFQVANILNYSPKVFCDYQGQLKLLLEQNYFII